MARLVRELVGNAGLRDSLAGILETMDASRDAREVTSLVRSVFHLIETPSPDPADDVARLGQGWVGEEALAIAIYSVCRARNFSDAVAIATNHDGDSDSTASIAGQIWGAMNGIDEIPPSWARRLDVLDSVCEVARGILSLDSRSSPAAALFSRSTE
jgi:ADP-ribosylglycohydrolase